MPQREREAASSRTGADRRAVSVGARQREPTQADPLRSGWPIGRSSPGGEAGSLQLLRGLAVAPAAQRVLALREMQRTLGNATVQRLVASARPAAASRPDPERLDLAAPGHPLPESVRSGMEGVLRADLSDVRVRVGPEAPALGAVAAATRSRLFFAPGEYAPETPRGRRVLGHELAHVVQQREGRIRHPGGDGVAIVEDRHLEAEADAVGRWAESLPGRGQMAPQEVRPASALAGGQQPVQRVKAYEIDKKEAQDYYHLQAGRFYKAETRAQYENPGELVPLVIEIMELSVESAEQKMTALKGTKLFTDRRTPVAFVIGLNSRAGNADLKALEVNCGKLAKFMEDNGLFGGAFSFLWKTTTEQTGGYTFPFLEARSLATLHPGARAVHSDLTQAFRAPVVRGMDADVRSDPLLTGQTEAGQVRGATFASAMRDLLQAISEGAVSLASGGYNWDVNDVPGAMKRLGFAAEASEAETIKSCIKTINSNEHEVRVKLAKTDFHRIYWPEPNTYTGLTLRAEGATAMREAGKKPGVQMKESTFYVNRKLAIKGMYKPGLTTRKPLKTYLDPFITFVHDVLTGKETLSDGAIRAQIVDIRQSHLSPATFHDIMTWQGQQDPELIKWLQDDAVIPAQNRCVGEISQTLRDALG
ncbi:MAG: DUF4157 domain-containing protein [Geminicoccaceae bacterium]